MVLRGSYRNVRVLDLSENIAGPLACMIFADLGADVIKIERPGQGDATRPLPPQRGDTGAVFLTVNRNKRSVALDFATPAGRDAVLRIARSADVVVESFRPGTADRMGLGFDDVAAVSPDVVYCSVSAFGRGELGHDRRGYDALVQAFTGIMKLTGSPAGPPARTAPSVLDISAGMWAAMSIMATLADHPAGAGAVRLESTLIDSGLFMMCHQIIGLLGADFHPQRLGSAAPSAAPYQEFATKDGSVVAAAITDRLFQKLCAAMDSTHLTDDDRFRTAAGRVTHRDELSDELQAIFGDQSSQYWLTHLDDAGIPVSPVNSLEEAVADPLTQERGLITTAHDGDRPPQLRLPLDQDRDLPLSAPPGLGQHTTEVLAEAGFTDAEILDLVGECGSVAGNGSARG
jgi:crotonobetainyl-CoA:carnitine CoA-transferase CaiB-like acyl-CoA transferase